MGRSPIIKKLRSMRTQAGNYQTKTCEFLSHSGNVLYGCTEESNTNVDKEVHWQLSPYHSYLKTGSM